tara:strand:- start:8 stop:436 length:429 start_codon:yes stop_codon:yes gene_type:complete
MATSPDTTHYYRGQYQPGLGSVGQYQASGTPYLTGSTITGGSEVVIGFPCVTKSITIINKDAASDDIRVHFASTGTGNTITKKHFVTLDSKNSSVTLNVKAAFIYLSAPGADADFEMTAELTSIIPPNGFDYNQADLPGISK